MGKKKQKHVKTEVHSERSVETNVSSPPLQPPSLHLPKSLKNSILSAGIKITEEFTSELKTTVLNEKADGYFMIYQVHYGWFLFEVNILNLVDHPSHYYKVKDQDRGILGRGGFGEAFVGEAYAKVFAVKRLIVFKEQEKVEIWNAQFYDRFHKKLKEALKEVCILKLLSALNIGPEAIKPMGFDIITYPKHIQFCIEYGRTVYNRMNETKHPQHFAFHVKKDLIQALKIMHSLHLVHGDIKPENIIECRRDETKWHCYEEQCQARKSVYHLIDFGLCRFVDEGEQRKTLTSFFGTYSYTGMEMKKICSNEEGYVNLYKNDKEALKITLEEVKTPSRRTFNEYVVSDPISGEDSNCLVEVYDRIFEFFFVGKSFYEYRYEKETVLEREIFDSMNILVVKRDLNLNTSQRPVQYHYLHDYTDYPGVERQNAEWLKKTLEFLLRHEIFKEWNIYHPNHQKQFCRPIRVKSGCFQINGKILNYWQKRNFKNFIEKDLTDLSAENVDYILGNLSYTPYIIENHHENLSKKLKKLALQKYDIQLKGNLQQILDEIVRREISNPKVVIEQKLWWLKCRQYSEKKQEFFRLSKEFLFDEDYKKKTEVQKIRMHFCFALILSNKPEQNNEKLKRNKFHLRQAEKIYQRSNSSEVKFIYQIGMTKIKNYEEKYLVNTKFQQLLSKTPITQDMQSSLMSSYYHINILFGRNFHKGEFEKKIDDFIKFPDPPRFHFYQILNSRIQLYQKKGQEKTANKYLKHLQNCYEKKNLFTSQLTTQKLQILQIRNKLQNMPILNSLRNSLKKNDKLRFDVFKCLIRIFLSQIQKQIEKTGNQNGILQKFLKEAKEKLKRRNDLKKEEKQYFEFQIFKLLIISKINYCYKENKDQKLSFQPKQNLKMVKIQEALSLCKTWLKQCSGFSLEKKLIVYKLMIEGWSESGKMDELFDGMKQVDKFQEISQTLIECYELAINKLCEKANNKFIPVYEIHKWDYKIKMTKLYFTFILTKEKFKQRTEIINIVEKFCTYMMELQINQAFDHKQNLPLLNQPFLQNSQMKKQKMLIYSLPAIIYQIDDMDNEEKAEQKIVFLLDLTPKIKNKYKYFLYSQFQQRLPYVSKNIYVLYEGLLMNFASKSQRKKILYYSRVLLQNTKDKGCTWFMFGHLTLIYHLFLEWKYEFLPQKNYLKICDRARKILYLMNYIRSSLYPRFTYYQEILNCIKEKCEKILNQKINQKRKFLVSYYKSVLIIARMENNWN